MKQHLATCEECRAELASYETLTSRLALAVPEEAPPDGLRQRIMDRVEAPHRQPVARREQQDAPGGWLAGLFRPWVLASLALLLLLVGSNLWWWQRTERRSSETIIGDMRVVAMSGSEAAPRASGTLVVSLDGNEGTLVVDDLPVLDEGLEYQLWLIRDGQRTSGGVFSVNPRGYGALWVASPEPLASYDAFGVTVEPEGGSPQPTGERVLSAGL